LSDQICDLVKGKNQLIEQNEALLTQVRTYQSDLNREKEKTTRLESQARQAKRGITLTYDYWGNRRSTRPGVMIAKMGENAAKFQEILELRDSHNWAQLLDVCEQEMKSTPEWLTPYMFAGIASANLGYREQAIELLRHVDQNAAGDPQYAEAAQLLRRIGTE